MLLNPDKHKLQFETISLSALREDGTMDEKKAKMLVKVFRPDRDGELSLIDWVKSVDKIYKNIRIFRAALQNSAQIDQAFSTIIDIAFFFVLFLVFLQILSFNPLQVFLTLSGVFLSFAFMFGSAASSYFNVSPIWHSWTYLPDRPANYSSYAHRREYFIYLSNDLTISGTK